MICCTAEFRRQAHDAHASGEAMYVNITRNKALVLFLYPPRTPSYLLRIEEEGDVKTKG